MITLTVTENLYFSAALRLPNTSNDSVCMKRVISELDLDGYSDTKMVNKFFCGVSGGKCKRSSRNNQRGCSWMSPLQDWTHSRL